MKDTERVKTLRDVVEHACNALRSGSPNRDRIALDRLVGVLDATKPDPPYRLNGNGSSVICPQAAGEARFVLNFTAHATDVQRHAVVAALNDLDARVSR